MDRTQVLFSFNFFNLFSSPCQRQCELITNRSSSILFLRHWWFWSYVPWKCEIFDNLKFQTNNFSLKRNNYNPAARERGILFYVCPSVQDIFRRIEHICTFFVTFFSTIDDRDLIFGHKRHIGTPYRAKRFWTHRSPTSCLPTLLIVIHIEHIYANFSSHFSQQLLMAEIGYLVTSFI